MRFISLTIVFTLGVTIWGFSQTIQEAEKKIQEKNYSSALKILDKLIEKNEKDTFSYFLRGRCYYELEKEQKSYDDFARYLELKPTDALARIYRGYILEGVRQYHDAINEFNVAIKYAKDTALACSYYHRGSCFLSVNSKKAAYNDLSKAAELNPSSKGIRINLAVVLCNLDSLDKGIVMFKQLLAEDPQDYISCQNIGYYSMKLEQYDTALVYYSKTLKINSKMPFVYNNRGYLKYKMKDNKGALEDINYSLKLDDRNSFAYKNRALVYIEQGESEKACEDLNKARALGFAEKYGNEVDLLIKKNCNNR